MCIIYHSIVRAFTNLHKYRFTFTILSVHVSPLNLYFTHISLKRSHKNYMACKFLQKFNIERDNWFLKVQVVACKMSLHQNNKFMFS